MYLRYLLSRPKLLICVQPLLETDMNLRTAEVISTYVYKRSLGAGGNSDYSFSTAVGLFNTVINVIFLLTVNKIVQKMNDGQGL